MNVTAVENNNEVPQVRRQVNTFKFTWEVNTSHIESLLTYYGNESVCCTHGELDEWAAPMTQR